MRMTTALPTVPPAGLLFSRGNAFSNLTGRLQQIRAWDRLLAESLPSSEKMLANHCHVIHADEVRLVLVVDSPNWATRLRFLVPTLLSTLQKQAGFSTLREISHRIALPLAWRQQGSAKSRPLPLSANTVSHLQQAAQGIRHPGLRAALLRMAGRHAQ